LDISYKYVFRDVKLFLPIHPRRKRMCFSLQLNINLTGDNSATNRKSKLRQIKKVNLQVLIKTGQLFGKDIDILFSYLNFH